MTRDTEGFLATWIASLETGQALTAEDVRRLQRVYQALTSSDKHHAQARGAQNMTAADHIDALVATGAKLTFAKPSAIYNGPVLILPPEMTS